MITLKKAIELSDLTIREAPKNIPPDVLAAIKLMVQAGQRIQVGRNNPGTDWNDLLPGETKEGTARGARALLT